MLSAKFQCITTSLWLIFFVAMIYAWWVMYAMTSQMGLNWYGIQVGKMNMEGMPLMNGVEFLMPRRVVRQGCSQYCMGPDIIVTQGKRSRVCDLGRIWDFGGKSAEIRAIDWSGAG